MVAFHLLLEPEEAALPGPSLAGWGSVSPRPRGDVLRWRGGGALGPRSGALGLGAPPLTLIILDGGHPISRCFGESRP